MRILVADDEALARYSLISILEEALPGTHTVIEAANGLELVERTRDSRPHIGFVDIRMPKMDGLKAIAAAHEYAPRTLWVVVSGHGDFAYAQKALKLGVEDFLLKPVEPGEMKLLLDRLAEKARSRQRQGNRDLEAHVSAVIGDTASPQDDSWFTKPRFWQAGMILWDSRLPDTEITARRRAFAALMQEILDDGDDDSGCIVSYTGGALLIVLAMPTGDLPAGLPVDKSAWWNRGTRVSGGLPMDMVIELWHRRFGSLRIHSREIMGDGIGDTWFLTRVVQDPIELFREIEEIGRVTSLRFIHRPSDMMDYSDIVPQAASSHNLAAADLLESMRETLMLGAEDDFHGMAHRLVGMMDRLTNINDGGDGPAWYSRYVIPLPPPPPLSPRVLARRLHDESHSLFTELRSSEDPVPGTASLVHQALDVMNRRYRETIGIAQVAEELGVTPNYLSTIFKRETGTGFTRRMTELRLEKSLELLTRPDANVGDIARSLGYQSGRHFTRLFKERYSMTPSQWANDRRN